MQWYARQIANYPSLIILIVLATALTCAIVSFTTYDLPSFGDPLQGFESRGTVLSQRYTAWRHLDNSTGNSLTVYPENYDNLLLNNSRNVTHQLFTEVTVEIDTNVSNESTDVNYRDEKPESYARHLVLPDSERRHRVNSREKTNEDDNGTFGIIRTSATHNRQNRFTPGGSNFFCSDSVRRSARFVVQSVGGENLFTAKSLRSMCQIDEKLRQIVEFTQFCENTAQRTCCRSWSLPNYVALLSNLSSCHEISDENVTYVEELLRTCAPYYYSVKLNHECTERPYLCRDAPKQCRKFNAVYNIFHYFTDTSFFGQNGNNSTKLTYSMLFLPFFRVTKAYYHNLRNTELSDGVTEVIAMELGLKYDMFNEYLLHDTIYVGIAAGAIYLLLWMYTASFFITFMVFMAVIFSLSIAYFIYVVIYQIPFFPFINVLTAVIAIGVGVDDACIYYKVWLSAKTEKNNGTLVKLVRDTLRHSCLSTFVTSITTAGAFFASLTSTVTAIRCFSIFAGTAIIANFIFTITWIPAAVVIAEKWCSSSCCLCIPPFGIYLPQMQKFGCCSSICNALWKMHYSFTDSTRVFFEKILPYLIIKLRFFWLLFFALLAAGGATVVFYFPSLRLPEMKEFQVFSDSHPFERYDLTLKKFFRFEEDKEAVRSLPITIVWGVLPVDNGNYLNPLDKGTIRYDPSFNIAAPESQKWFHSFCQQFKRQKFYKISQYSASVCFIERFKEWMEKRPCISMSGLSQAPCCSFSKFPYTEKVFNLCIREAMRIDHRGQVPYIRTELLPRLSKDTNEIKAVIAHSLTSSYHFTNSYTEMHKYVTEVNTWVSKAMESAPEGMKNGWFVSYFKFYVLQDSLARGTMLAIGVAIAVAFAALLVTTLNLLISIYAIITISCIIIVNVASLVLLGWKLSIVESITVSLAIGLAVDFTLHYGVAYRISPHHDRESSIIFSLSQVGSAVTMAAFTSFVAGACMLPATVLAYQQIGMFLVLLMSISWAYATLFFHSLLRIMGPVKGQLQLNCPTVQCCKNTAGPVEKASNNALSESTLSTSSAGCPIPIPSSESHELEPLTNVKGTWRQFIKHKKYKIRERSGSFSAALSSSRSKDPTFFINATKPVRKVSLPIVSMTTHSDSCTRHLTGATSSSTIVYGDDQIMSPQEENGNTEVQCRKEISI